MRAKPLQRRQIFRTSILLAAISSATVVADVAKSQDGAPGAKISGAITVFEPGKGRSGNGHEARIEFSSTDPLSVSLLPSAAPDKNGNFAISYERNKETPTTITIVPRWVGEKPYYTEPEKRVLQYTVPEEEKVLLKHIRVAFMHPTSYAEWRKAVSDSHVTKLYATCRCARKGGAPSKILLCYERQAKRAGPDACNLEIAQELAEPRAEALMDAMERTEGDKNGYRMELADLMQRVGQFCEAFDTYMTVDADQRQAVQFGVNAAWSCVRSASPEEAGAKLKSVLETIDDAEPVKVFGDYGPSYAAFLKDWWELFRLLGDKRFEDIAEALNAEPIELKAKWDRFRGEVAACYGLNPMQTNSSQTVTAEELAATEALLREPCRKAGV